MTVKPRKRKSPPERPVLAVCMMDEQACYQGELLTLRDVVQRLREQRGKWTSPRAPQIPPALVAVDDPGALIGMLDRRFRRHQEPNSLLWQYRVSLRPSSVWLGRHASPYTALSPHLALFGWAAQRGRQDGPDDQRTVIRRSHGVSRYYVVLDVFGWPQAADVLDRYPGLLVEQIHHFATDLQRFCIEQQLPVGTSPAAVAGALLKDPRFWPDERRKVPAATNARARKALPGNFYRLCVPAPVDHTPFRLPGGELALHRSKQGALHLPGEVLELDQNGAHHAAAMRVRPPHSDSLYAWGRFYSLPRTRDVNPADLIDVTRLRREHGLLLCAIESYARLDPMSHPATNHQGVRWRYVWTPELDLIQSIPGVDVLGAAAGWTANRVDEGLSEYAWWAGNELAGSSEARRTWLKPVLLAAYGLLAARPRPFVNLWRWGRGDPLAVTFPSGHTLHGHRTETELAEPGTANVIWRGMVEAHVRAESIRYARRLRSDGWRVVSIYADAVYVQARSDREPELAPGWRVAQRLHGVCFHSPTHFTSDEVDKLPGIPHERRGAA